ncbi:DUF4397 domain-containing protein [Chitinophaga sp. 30R24]|uniref:DUF4397 domain-containing protein n=1 Tax=Chitinophaga sp. 30R24 TaxID=3248838 RepID=UPI003B916230
MLTKKNRIWAALALLAAVTGLSSCLKNNTDNTPVRPTAQIWFLNVSNSTVPATFYDNGRKISNDTTNIGFNFYSRYSVYGGPHIFELRKKGSDSVIVSSTYQYDSTDVLNSSSPYYTYLIYNNPVQAVTIKTDLSTASTSKINIRCFNLSQNAGPVDFYVGSEKIDSNRNYMTQYQLVAATSFAQFSSFSINNTVTVKKAGTTEVLATANSSQLIVGSFNTGNVYTIYFAGTAGSTGTDKLMVNAFPSYYPSY